MNENPRMTTDAVSLRGTSAVSRLHDPVWCARMVLGAELWRAQRDILAAVARHSRVAVKSCHASGKTFGLRSRFCGG